MPNERALRRLHAEVVSARQVAIAARAPGALLDELAASAGLLEALAGWSPHGMVTAVLKRAKQSLAAWTAWQRRALRAVAAA